MGNMKNSKMVLVLRATEGLQGLGFMGNMKNSKIVLVLKATEGL